MRILISNVSIKDYPAAAFLRSYYLAKGLASKGHSVTFITNQNNTFKFPFDIEIRDKVKIVSFPSILKSKYNIYGYTLFSTILKILYVLFKKFDLVHSDLHRNTSLWPCLVHRFFYKSKLVSEWWDYLGPTGQYDSKSKYWKATIGPYDNYMELKSKKISDGVIVLAEFLREKASEIGIPKEKIFKLWGASDVDKIKFYVSPYENRKLFGLNNDKIILIFSGMSTAEFEENLHTFRAIKKIRKEGVDLCIARTGKKFSSEYLKKYNITDELLQLGYVDYKDYDKLLSCANAFVLIQEYNNKNRGRWPNSCGDYLAAGRPIFSNSIGDLIELENQFKDGFIIINKTNEEEIYDKLKYFTENLDKHTLIYPKIRNFAEKFFSWDFRTNELISIYNKILSK